MTIRQFATHVLSDYEVARCLAAIEAIELTGKPIAEAGCRKADEPQLTIDLEKCIRIYARASPQWRSVQDASTHTRAVDVRTWIRPHEDYLRYGFYTQPWALEALDFVDRDESLSHFNRTWISGLVFGYRADAIQAFIDRHHLCATPR